jgi:hypothetical protein
MSSVQFFEPLISQQIDGTALTNTTTPTSILAPAARFLLPANFFKAAGQQLILRAAGRISTAASSPGTLTFDARFGSVIVFNGGASGTLATSASNLTWLLEMVLTCRSIGASTSATMLGTGKLTTAALSASTPIQLLPASSPAAGTGFDSTAAAYVDLFATWSVANASNSIRCDEFRLDAVN